uniref:Zgc:101559 n=1 Tax=Cyprinus carpio TaxID=7962 RepID=A0A8C1Y2D4_CYPCA
MSIENTTGNNDFSTIYTRDSLASDSGQDYDSAQARVFKIIVIGDSNVGKTCLTYRFCVDFRERTLHLDGENIKLQIWDTAGQERFRKSMVEHYYRNVHAIIFVYDVSSLASFESLPEWIEECSRHSVPPMVPRILVGNKCDLRGMREVSTFLAQRLADSYNFPLFETSARDPAEKEHVDAIFLTLAYRLKNHKPLRLKQPSESSFLQLAGGQEENTPCLC